MINTTLNEIVFNSNGESMHDSIRECLVKTAYGLLDMFGLQEQIEHISTKTSKEGLYSKLVIQHTLPNKHLIFDAKYVENAFLLYQLRPSDDHKKLVYKFIGVEETDVEFRVGYIRGLYVGIGPFLIALHGVGAITLPVSFNWPRPRNVDLKRLDTGKPFASELIAFIRTLEPQSDDIPDPAFSSVGAVRKRREFVSSLGTKLLLATGWNSVQDANPKDLARIRAAHGSIESDYSAPLPFFDIVDVLWRKYGETINLTPESFAATLKDNVFRPLRSALINQQIELGIDSGAAVSIETLMRRQPSEASPSVLRKFDSLPGLKIDFKSISKTWLTIEESFIRGVKLENKKALVAAIGWLNVYLFLYLPYWFAENPETSVKFPDSPSLLLSGVFITKLVEIEGPTPITFMEMMDALQQSRKWVGNSFYAVLKLVEKFFDFIERKSDALPGSKGFKQPLGPEDFPKTSSKRNTEKRPIERRLFGVTLGLTEALIAYSDVVTDRILDGELDSLAFQAKISRFGRVIDTFQVANDLGYIPVLFYRGKTIPLRIIPNCLSFTEKHKLKGFSPEVQIPRPHALNQIFVALHTGLRHNHIQWLDARSFDRSAVDDDTEFCLLHVNTDKHKSKPWDAHVSWCVIERLRQQRLWRELFDEPSFLCERWYNNNPKTKWAPILPLFSFATDGRPHSDGVYERVWGALLGSVQGLLTELGESPNLPLKSHGSWLPRIGMLEPPGVEYNDPNAIEKRKKAGRKKYVVDGEEGVKKLFVPLGFKTPMTPHSTRVSVVQQFMTYLPAEHIGRFITGQTTRTVYYYYHPDAEDLKKEGLHQAMSLRELSNSAFDSLVKVDGVRGNRVSADDPNSSLAIGLRENLNETLEAFGCVSLALADTEASGLVVLRTNGAVDAVLNKTEICPYGNRCPSDVIRLLGGPNRCGLCPYAVRAVDHLPAVAAKSKQMLEKLADKQCRLDLELQTEPRRFSNDELDALERECADLAAEATGWQLSEEVLYHTVQRIKEGQDLRRWVVQKPDIVLKDLLRIRVPDNITAYTLARLQECIAFPTMESPQVRARFDLLRRQLLARGGKVSEALSPVIPVNPAEECAGLLRIVVESHRLGYHDIVSILEGDRNLTNLPNRKSLMLTDGE
jgi:hypothetical protein